jgi:putative transposase
VYGNEELPEWTAANTKFRLEVTKKPIETQDKKKEKKKFKVVKWRWVVERTFAWLGRYRRNSRDYEKLPESSESMLKISSIQLMINRLKPKSNKFVFHYRKAQKT